MQFSLWTCIYGILVFLSWKIGSTIYAYIRMRRKCLKLPQKKSHWLFGRLRELKNSKAYMDYALDMAKTGSKVYCIWIGPIPAVGVTHPETFKELIGQEHRKARGRMDRYRFAEEWLGEGLLISEERKWERSRKLLTPAFHFSILTGYVDVMNRVSDTFQEKVLHKMSESESMDIYPLACRATLDAMMKCSLSFDGCMQSKDEDIRAFTYLSQYIKEVMRVYSPVPMIARRSAKTLVLDGFEIPPGTCIRIDINIYATHHNPAVWDKPEEFNPDRYGADNKDENDTFGFIPFSAGSRNCIGQVFALNELKICLAKFVKRFEVFPDPEHKPELVPDVVTRSATGLKVIIKKRC